VVLSGEHDVVDPKGLAIRAVANRDLDLAIGPQIAERLASSDLGQPPRQPVRKGDRERHELGRLVAGVAKHHSGVTGAAHVDALSDVGRLLVDAGDDAARLGVEPVLGARVADLADRLPDDPRNVDIAVGCDLPDHDHKAGGHHRLARHPSERILGQDRVENGV